VKVVSVVGARPEFIQAAPVSRALRPRHQEVLVHTGQHYDYQMSALFFQELGLPAPDYNLEVGSGPHGQQTGEILARMERVLMDERPDWVLVRGDTNSTLAGALAAAKLHVPVGHIEAGLRSFNRWMPEEINRIVADRVADLLFCPTPTAVSNLAAEGILQGVHLVGDVMYEAILHNLSLAEARSRVLAHLGLAPRGYLLLTVHRAENTDIWENLRAILAALDRLEEPVIFLVHPRTRKRLGEMGWQPGPSVHMVEPQGYFDTLVLEKNARILLTDSGGMQKEVYCLGTPCLTLREQTEWVETVEVGWNRLVGAEADKIVDAVYSFHPPAERPSLYGNGQSSQAIVRMLEATT
jgi:UDP-N-acetylglucosamine 2-epimerase